MPRKAHRQQIAQACVQGEALHAIERMLDDVEVEGPGGRSAACQLADCGDPGRPEMPVAKPAFAVEAEQIEAPVLRPACDVKFPDSSYAEASATCGAVLLSFSHRHALAWSAHPYRMEIAMRKMIMMAIAGLLWKKFGGKMAQRYPLGRGGYRRF